MTEIPLPKSFWKSWTFILSVAIFLLLILPSIYIFFLRPVPLVISAATTRITGPLTENGEIDFFKALEERFYPPELATEDNGFRDFVRLFGDVFGDTTSLDREFYRLQKYEKLGLDPNEPPTLEFPLAPHVVIKNFYAAKSEEVPDNENQNRFSDPWTLEQLPMLEEWLKEIDIPMDVVATAIQKPIFFVPTLGHSHDLFAFPLPVMQEFLDCVRIFQARATYRIGQGNIDGAIDDKLTVYRLGRLIAQGGCTHQRFVAIAIEGAATAIPVGANPKHPLTERQIRRLLDGLDALPSRVAVNETFEWERFSALSAIQYFIRHRAGPGMMSLDYVTANNLPRNWNIVYRRMNEVFDALQEPSPRTKYHSLISAASTKHARGRLLGMLSPNGRGEIFADYLIDLAGACQDTIETSVFRSQCEENLQRLSLAILLYQCEHGKLPDENWVTQITPYLGENPERYFSCPSNPAPEGATSYAMVRYDDTVAGSLLLVELQTPVAFDKAVVSVDDVLNRKGTGSLHPGGMNSAHRSAAVRFLSETITHEELEQLLGQ